jgi:hypothetical protein
MHSFLLALLFLLPGIYAHNIKVDPRKRGFPPLNCSLSAECFFEDLHRDDKMTVTFLAGANEEGAYELDFWVCALGIGLMRDRCAVGDEISF